MATDKLKAETFAKPADVDAIPGVAAQRAQTYQADRQASEQRTTQKCAEDGGFAKVSGYLKPLSPMHNTYGILLPKQV